MDLLLPRPVGALVAASVLALSTLAPAGASITEAAPPPIASTELSPPPVLEPRPAAEDRIASTPSQPSDALSAPGAPPVATELRFAELPNFHRVDENLYRGGQPGAGGLARLKALGVRSVLNLRYERKQSLAEESEAKAAGLRYYSIPMYGLARPTDIQISSALALIDEPENRPLFVHCERGSDRTGAVVACYRVARANWTAEQAIREAMGFGMYRIEIAKRAYIRDYQSRLTR